MIYTCRAKNFHLDFFSYLCRANNKNNEEVSHFVRARLRARSL